MLPQQKDLTGITEDQHQFFCKYVYIKKQKIAEQEPFQAF